MPCAYTRYYFCPYTNPAEKSHFVPQSCSSLTSVNLHFQEEWFYWSQTAVVHPEHRRVSSNLSDPQQRHSHPSATSTEARKTQLDRRPFSAPAQVENTACASLSCFCQDIALHPRTGLTLCSGGPLSRFEKQASPLASL